MHLLAAIWGERINMSKKDKIENEITIHINSDARLTRKEIEAYLRRTYPLSRFKISDVTGEKCPHRMKIKGKPTYCGL